MKTLLNILIVLFIFSCTAKKPAAFNLIAAVDISTSRDSTNILTYKSIIKEHLLPNMGQQDGMTVLPVDYNSQTSLQELFTIDFSKNNYHNEFAGMQETDLIKKSHRDSVAKAIQAFDNSFTNSIQQRKTAKDGTDIFGILEEGKKYNRLGYTNVIVLLADMLQVTDKKSMNFEESLNSDADIAKFLDKAKVIDLSDNTIFVITGAQPYLKIEKYNGIKKFWEEYFRKCHATLLEYSSGHVSAIDNFLTNRK